MLTINNLLQIIVILFQPFREIFHIPADRKNYKRRKGVYDDIIHGNPFG